MNNDQTKEHHDAGATVLKIERAPSFCLRLHQPVENEYRVNELWSHYRR